LRRPYVPPFYLFISANSQFQHRKRRGVSLARTDHAGMSESSVCLYR
jgi:hypothetical protein